MELTFCGVPEEDEGQIRAYLERLVSIGATSVQTYIYWNKVEREPGVFDWSHYDRFVDLLAAYGLKWVPFLIAGPWYVTPEWVRREPETVFCRCLEHGCESGIISIYSPNLERHVRRLLASCAERYVGRGIIESILLGITGDYGEAIHSVLGNWPGQYHGHLGYWCGEEPARTAFRRHLEGKYEDLEGLNRSWGTAYQTFAEIQPSLRAAAPSSRAWLDQVEWYRGEMTNWARTWLRIAGECFPGTEIYLCTGGDGTPQHGSDFSAQCKLAAELGAGIRITNEGSDYLTNFLITRLVASAARHYGCYFGYEPASTVDARGVAARIYNAAASGAHQLFEYVGNILDGGAPKPETWEQFRTCRAYLREERPEVETAVFMPLDDFALRETGTTGYFRAFAKKLRGYTDFDLIDAGMVEDGALERYRFLFVVGAARLEGRTLKQIRHWVDKGGVLFTNAVAVETLDGESGWRELLGLTPASDWVCGVNPVRLLQPDLTPKLAANPEVLVLEGYAALAPTVVPLGAMRDYPEARSLWANRLGRGAAYVSTLKADFDPEESDSYAWFTAGAHFWSFVQDVLGEARTIATGAPPPRSLEENHGVFAAAFKDRMLYLNFTPAKVEKNGVPVPAYGLAEVPCDK